MILLDQFFLYIFAAEHMLFWLFNDTVVLLRAYVKIYNQFKTQENNEKNSISIRSGYCYHLQL